MTRAIGALLVLCCLGGCEPVSLPAPSIVSVEPERVIAGDPSVLTVQVSAVLPVTVDYREQTVDTAQPGMKLLIAGQEAEIAFVESDGKLVAAVPPGLAQGAYDVGVALADGREAVRQEAFSVVAPVTFVADGGTPRPIFIGDAGTLLGDNPGRGGITGYQIDPIGEQVRGVPFKVTIRAVGPQASSFQGTGVLRASKGLPAPHNTRAFARGVDQEEITLQQPGGSVFLMVEDTLGNKGLSNSFRVRAH
jgi:hypothetical protein